jgi:radical SAM protein with 4Fe4S-binding SPASM domain
MDKEHLHTGRELELFRPTIRISEVLDELIADFQKSGVQLHPLQRVHMDSHEPWNSTRMYFHKPKEPHFTRACGIPFESLFVDQAGRVFPCCHSSGGPTLGQIGEQTFDEIWRGKKAQDFREALMDPARLPETCHHCSIVPWDEHPNRKYKAEITSCVYGDKGKIKLTVRNAGTVTWTQAQPLKLGCSRPRDRRSDREMPSWSYHHRVAVMRDASVPPGGTTVLEFELGPAGKTEEYFELLLEGQTWLYGTVHSYK